VKAHYGAFYILRQDDEQQNVMLKLFAGYAYRRMPALKVNFPSAKDW
jgi:hypothetical protein